MMGNNRRRKVTKRTINSKGWLVLILLGIMIGLGLFYGGLKVYEWMYPEPVSSSANTTSKAETPKKADKAIDIGADKVDKEQSDKVKMPVAGLYSDQQFGKAKYLIHIHKLSYKLELYEKGKKEPLRSYDIAVARNTGDKQKPGDNRTPTSWGRAVEIPSKYVGAKIGVNSQEVPFRVEEICDASTWSHDFRDGKGVIEKAYGPWFISLDTGWEGIGIHGTHDPDSIGTKASEGCIRLLNKNVDELKKIIYSDNKGIGTGVIISED